MVDLYCERTGPGLWSEPVNALTNVAYLAAAWALWVFARRFRSLGPADRVLVGLMVAIGIGSALFHTLATPWARILDEVPILLFQLSFLWLYGKWIMGMTGVSAALLLVGFLAAVYIGRQFPQILNGSLMYAPAFLVTAGLGVHHCRSQQPEPFTLLAGAGVLAAAVVFRTMDNAICPSFPFGTHFLWHVSTAAVLYLFGRGLLMNMPRAAWS